MKGFLLLAIGMAWIGAAQAQAFYSDEPVVAPEFALYSTAAWPQAGQAAFAGASLLTLFREAASGLPGTVESRTLLLPVDTEAPYLPRYRAQFIMTGPDMESLSSYYETPGVPANPGEKIISDEKRYLQMLGSVGVGAFLILAYYGLTRRRPIET